MPADPPRTLGIMLLSGTHERAHYAFVLATGAAALGRHVVLFATNAGCRALLADWSELSDSARDAAVRARGVVGLGELRDSAQALDVMLIACEAGLRAEAISPIRLIEGTRVAGVATFLSEIGNGQLVSL